VRDGRRDLVDRLQLLEPVGCRRQTQRRRLAHETKLGVDVSLLVLLGEGMPCFALELLPLGAFACRGRGCRGNIILTWCNLLNWWRDSEWSWGWGCDCDGGSADVTSRCRDCAGRKSGQRKHCRFEEHRDDNSRRKESEVGLKSTLRSPHS